MKAVVLLFVVFSLSGCAITRLFVAEKDNYLAAETVSQLDVPADLDPSRIQDAWEIPVIPEQPAARVYPQGAPKPATIVGENDPNTIRIKRLGERRWMVLQRRPETVWPLVRQFLRQYDVPVITERPEAGEIVTGGLRFSADVEDPFLIDLVKEFHPSASDGDYMVFRIEQGIKTSTSEIHMRYLRPDQTPHPDMWLSGDADRGELEGKLLTSVAEFDVSALSASTVSSIARQIATQPKASLIRDDEGHPILVVNVDFERAWATLTRAFESAEVEVKESDRDSGTFEIVLPKLEAESQTKKRGFLGIMFGKRDSKAREQGAIVRLQDQNPSSYMVWITRADGEHVETDYAEQFLAMLREHAA